MGIFKKILSIKNLWYPNKSPNKDKPSLREVTKVWKPEDKSPIVLLRWMMTFWCNYKCSYCIQPHNRFLKTGEYSVHAFDNYPVDKWIEAFKYHFKETRLSLVITGGEPMLDKKKLIVLLNVLTSMKTLECIRIDTNTSLILEKQDINNPDKLILMCTYHPTQTMEGDFLKRINNLVESGYKIGMVNYVVTRDSIKRFRYLKEKFRNMSIPLHPNPLWDSSGLYSEEDIQILREELPETDFLYRTGIKSPYGEQCLFPVIGMQMDYTGRINVGCHLDLYKSFFDQSLPLLFSEPVLCPMEKCYCLDMYSFLLSVNRNITPNPLQIYSELLLKRSQL